ncbi:MAG: polysaccharide biosynthesis C-terminal domain-containing protein [Flavobacteriaceae bacterium]
MGIVYKQSAKNTAILFMGFAIGGLNVLFLYTHFLDANYYGLITFLLSTATIILPFLLFGMHNSVVKFYSAYSTKKERDGFLTTSLFLPLVFIIPSILIGLFAYEFISTLISKTNPLIKDYTFLIVIFAIFMGYFELFYAWSKVQMQSVIGNFIKEIFARFCTSILLILVFYNKLTNEQFIYSIVIIYGIRMVLMLFYALSLYKPTLEFSKPKNSQKIISYSLFMIVAGSAGFILLEIDKFMIPQIQEGISKVAYYAVGVYIASVIGIPGRAMQQIATPITAKELNAKNLSAVEALYKSSSLNQLLAGGLLFLLINLNLQDLYAIINRPEYANGTLIVLLISIAKIFELAMGTNTAILSNSKYYKSFFYIALAMAISVVFANNWLINLYGNNGAAMATLLVVVLFVTFKIAYIKYKMRVHPFSKNTYKIVFITVILFVVFYYINFWFNPYFNIILRTLILSILYIWMSLKLEISREFNDFIKTIKAKF